MFDSMWMCASNVKRLPRGVPKISIRKPKKCVFSQRGLSDLDLWSSKCNQFKWAANQRLVLPYVQPVQWVNHHNAGSSSLRGREPLNHIQVVQMHIQLWWIPSFILLIFFNVITSLGMSSASVLYCMQLSCHWMSQWLQLWSDHLLKMLVGKTQQVDYQNTSWCL